jgi:hypothetical protein
VEGNADGTADHQNRMRIARIWSRTHAARPTYDVAISHLRGFLVIVVLAHHSALA